MQIGFSANPRKQGALAVRDTLMQEASARGVQCLLFEDAASLLASEQPLDALTVVGGDGSLLRFASAAAARDIPLLGINLGRIGFLSELQQSAFSDAIARLSAGDYLLDRRMMLRCTVNGEEPLYCLNDVLVFKRTFSGIAEIGIEIDGMAVGTVFCDGMIAATPTGATAYSLSAGGPILSEGLNAIAVTPVCPHTLHIRPIVTAAAANICFTAGDGGFVSLDGMRTRELCPGDTVHITGAARTCNFIRFGKQDLYALIREKLS